MRERCSKKQNYWTCQGNKGVRAYLFGSKHAVGKIKTQHKTTTMQEDIRELSEIVAIWMCV